MSKESTITPKNNDTNRTGQYHDVLDILVKNGSLIKVQADHIREQSRVSNKKIDQILEEDDLVSQERLIQAYGEFFDLPTISLKNIFIPTKVIQKIPEVIARKYNILVFDQQGEKLKIAIAKPYLLQSQKPGVLADIQKKQKVDVQLYLTTPDDFRATLERYHSINQENVVKTTEKKVEKKQPLPEEKPKPPTVIDILVSQRLLDQKEAFEILEKSKKENKSPDAVIREEGQVSGDELAKAEAQLYNLPYISLREKDIIAADVKRFPESISEEYQVVVFETIAEKAYKVATSQPENSAVWEIVEFLQKKYGIETHLYVTSQEDLDLALAKYKEVPLVQTPKTEMPAGPSKAEEPVPEELGDLDIGTLIKKDIQSVNELSEIVKSGDVPRIVAGLINFALVKKASDIHIEPWENETHVRYRIDGVLKDIIQVDKKIHPAIIARIKISARLRIDEQRLPQDGRFEANFRDRTVDIRVSTLPTSHGEKSVLRLLDKSKKIISLEELGLTGRGYQILTANIKKPYGMILSTGPTGSGKTTTLYAILQSINSSQTNIVTLEDPIEYEIDGVNHCQARPDIGFSFAEGLRSILRQDPNVIMIGEIRDKDTAGMAVHASLTGHLVLSSLHTNDAVGAIPRLIDMGIEPFLIASSLSSVVAQRLVRKICPKCKQQVSLPAEILEKINKELEKIPASEKTKIKQPLTFWRGKGCSACEEGYSGRIGIFEVMPVTSEIQQLTIHQSSSGEMKEKVIEEGMITMKQDGILKALRGITSIDEVLRVTLIEK